MQPNTRQLVHRNRLAESIPTVCGSPWEVIESKSKVQQSMRCSVERIRASIRLQLSGAFGGRGRCA